MQSQGVASTVKHYLGNNSMFDRHNTDSVIDERTMREIYLPIFEAAVKEAHIAAIMDSYNLTNEFGWPSRDQQDLSIPRLNQEGRKVALRPRAKASSC
jgi:hypothetical protein